MEAITIKVHPNQYKTAKLARRDGKIPIICYAKEVEPTQYTVDYQEFRRAFIKAGKSAIITLNIEDKDEQAVLVHEFQYTPVSDEIMHIDFMAIKKGQKISTQIPLVFIGEAPAVKEEGGTFMSNHDKVSIECLPKDLPHEIEVDISSLVDFHTSLTVADIKVDEKITILDPPDLSIATVAAPREEEEELPISPTEGASEGEVATEGTAAEGGADKEGGGEEKKEG